MARKSTGTEALEKAQQDLISATTINQLQVAQAVVMPLLLGLTLTETASVIGKTAGWVARSRISYIKKFSEATVSEGRGGRRNSLLTLDQELYYVAYAIAMAGRWGAARLLREIFKEHRDLTVARSTAIRIIERVERTRKTDLEREVQKRKI